MRYLLAFLMLLLAAGCATGPALRLSGLVEEGEPSSGGLTIGLVADSQLQTHSNYARSFLYRHPLADRLVKVSLRPPVLDWASRSLLLSNLQSMRARNVSAIFYLGDGANNGCFDELAREFPIAPATTLEVTQAGHLTQAGLLPILDRFRQESGVPVYFVLGNHDLLAAGSTGDREYRREFCEDTQGRNWPLDKAKVIALVDRFNRGNARFEPTWNYVSNYVPGGTEEHCGSEGSVQHYRWGCYLAARVDHRSNGHHVRFMLLDTNDWASVTRPHFGKLEQLGLWGAMSFGRDASRILSQTDWFASHAGDHVPMRVALMHYDVPSLEKRVFGLVLSRLSQRFMDLFSVSGNPRRPRQDAAVAISAHTHNKLHVVKPRRFLVGCKGSGCEPRQKLELVEINIGSTTDFSNYATVVHLQPGAGATSTTRYTRVEAIKEGCRDVYQEVARTSFPNAFQGKYNRGWRAIGINPRDPHAYRHFEFNELTALWLNLERFGGANLRKAACMGRFAAMLEDGQPWPSDVPRD